MITLVSESTHLLGALNTYLEKAVDGMNFLLQKIDLDKLSISDEIKELITGTSSDILNRGIEFLKNILTSFLEYIKSIPTIVIYSVITILATYFITSDKFYILDRLEHHIPKKILGKMSGKLDKIIASLGRLFKSTSYYDRNFFYHSFNGTKYFLFMWYECWLSFTYGNFYWICRCTSDTSVREQL